VLGFAMLVVSILALFYALESCSAQSTDAVCTLLMWRRLPVALGYAGFAVVFAGSGVLALTVTRKAFAEGRGDEDPGERLPWIVRISPLGSLVALAHPVMGWVWTYLFFSGALAFALGTVAHLMGADIIGMKDP
jgi:hypothetical protein